MNVRDMVPGVKRELQHYPDTLRSDLAIKAALATEYESLATEQPWNWLRRATSFWTFPDLTLASGSLTRRGDRSFTVPRATLTTAGFASANALTAFEDWRPFLSGASFDLADTSLRSSGNGSWERAPFEVEFVKDFAAGSADKFYLDPRATITSFTGNEGSFKLWWPRYRLPSNLAQVLGVRNATDKMPLTALTIDEMLRLRQDVALGRTSHFAVDVEGSAPRIAPAFYPDEGLTNVAFAAEWTNEDAFGFRNAAPNGDLWTVTSSTGTATATQFPNGKWEVGIAWYYAGRWSPMSVKPVTINHTDGYGNLVIASTPAMPSSEYGRRLGIFVSRNGAPFVLATMWGTADATGTSLTVNPYIKAPGTVRRFDEMYPGNSYQFVKLWPRPSVTTQLTLEYLARPLRLMADTDAPEFDGTHHDVIVLRAALRMLSRNEQEAAFRRVDALADQAYKRLCRRYNAQAHIRATKGSIDRSYMVVPPPPTINWNGDV